MIARIFRSFWRFLAAITGRRAPSKSDVASSAFDQTQSGPQTKRRIDSLSFMLNPSDRDGLLAIGRTEWELIALHEQLGSLSGLRGDVVRAVETLRHEIDVMLSYPDGMVASTLLQVPARRAEDAEQSIVRLTERAGRLSASGDSLLSAISIASQTRQELTLLLDTYASVLPMACESVGLSSLVGELESIVTPASAERLARTVAECVELLERQRGRLGEEITRHRAALARLGDGEGNTAGSLEECAQYLRRRVDELAAGKVSASATEACQSADVHIAHLKSPESSAVFSRRPATRSEASPRMPTPGLAETRARWVELRRFTVKRAASPRTATRIRTISTRADGSSTQPDLGLTGVDADLGQSPRLPNDQ
jgi:hypothetical protein